MYIWRPCELSDRFVEALAERVRAGVSCRVLVDPIGSEEVSGDKDFDQKIERRLVDAGVEVHYYRPLAGKVLGRLLGRNHQKLCIVDGRIGYTGGFGIWKVWEGDGRAKENWRDTHVRVEGPAVCRMQLLVDDWLTVVGSTNLDALSLNKLGEGSLVLADPEFATKLERCWERDLECSKEITLKDGGRTNPWRRLARRATQLMGRDR